MTTYPDKPESLMRFESPEPEYKTVQAVIPPEIAAQLQGIAEKCLDRWPDENVAVAAAPYYFQGQKIGHVWVRFTVVDTRIGIPGKAVEVQTVNGSEPWYWLSHGGVVNEDTAVMSAKALNYVALVGKGEIIEYRGKPFTKAYLEGAMPEWAKDEGSAEKRLRQQELREEMEEAK